MIKIQLSHRILEKHRKYMVCESNIKACLEEFLSVNYFNEYYVDKILTFNVKDSRKNEFVKVLQSKLKTELNKRKFELNEKEYLNNESKRFIKFLLGNVKSLEDCDLKKCKKYNYKCTNIFLARPKELNWIQKNIISKLYKSISIIFELEVYFNIKNEKNIKYKYSDIVLDILGYKTFSSKEFKAFYKDEYKFLVSISNDKFYDSYLKAYNFKEKTENTRGKPVSQKTLNNIKCALLKDIQDLKKKSNSTDEFCYLLDKLYEEFNNLSLIKSDGTSIGRNLFTQKVNEKVKRIMDEIEDKKISIEKSITLYNIEDYNNEYDSCWNAYQFVMELGVQTCPYCNRQYVSPIYSSRGKLRADLDHFLPKYRHPYFSMSIFNLVPSCKFCNSSLKSISNFSYENNINPYEQGFEDILKFTYNIKSYTATVTEKEFEIKLKEHITDEKERNIVIKAKNNAETFQIENLYNYHKKEVLNLIKKRIIYTNEYIKTLRKQHKNLFNSDQEILEFLIGNYLDINDLNKKPLSKLTQDICEELGFIEKSVPRIYIEKLEKLLEK